LLIFANGEFFFFSHFQQARPQEGEIFGEFPPRHELHHFTRFPVIVPSSTPGYNSVYSPSYLISRASNSIPGFDYVKKLTDLVSTDQYRGYCQLLIRYLVDACGPKRGIGQRTSLYGLQRPPVNGQFTVLRVEKNTSFDDLAVHLLPFIVTNARSVFFFFVCCFLFAELKNFIFFLQRPSGCVCAPWQYSRSSLSGAPAKQQQVPVGDLR
jgi:hypothetical protein